MTRLLPLLLVLPLLVLACTRAEPTVPLRHEMPPLDTAVPERIFKPLSHSLLAPTDLGNGWRGEACPSAQPAFCLFPDDGDWSVASLSLEVQALTNNQIMRGLLEAADMALGHEPQPDEAEYGQTVQAVLAELADLTQAAAVAQSEAYSVIPLPRQPVPVGSLTGLAFGYQLVDEADESLEYVRYYATFDGNALYYFLLSSDLTVAWDEVETAAVALLSQLQFPPPVLATDVERVRVEMRVSLSALQGQGFIQHLYGGELLAVLGVSEDGNWWSVDCPEPSVATTCWLPNDTGRVRPR